MDETAQRDALRELTARGLVSAHPAPSALSTGNSDRQSNRGSWRVTLPNGTTARLLLVERLAPQAAAHTEFHRECPRLIPRPLFHVAVSGGEAFAEEFFAGTALADTPIVGSLSPARIQHAVAQARQALAETTTPSTEELRAAEWSDWAASLTGGTLFTATEVRLLREAILPRLYTALTHSLPPATRWTNGDFVAANLLVDAGGGVRLIDMEFARRTHFFAEDAVRFHVLSDIARRHPEYFPGLSDPGPAWHLFFWLRQLQLEAQHNTAAYLQTVRPTRLGVIRRLAEEILGLSLAGWSEPALPVHWHLEKSDGDEIAGWCHVPSAAALRAIVLTSATERLVEVPLETRPDVQSHFQGHPGALHAGFRLPLPPGIDASGRWLAAISADGTLLPFRTLQSPRDDAPPGELPAMDRLRTYPAESWPLLSVVMPVFNPPVVFLEQAVASVIGQSYSHWELILVDDHSTDAAVQARLGALAASDARIQLRRLPANGGISAATNAGLALARGSHVAWLDHDDVLAGDALAEVAAALLADPSLDVLYTDQDKWDEAGRSSQPFRKPAWSPVYFLGVMYVGHLLAARRDLVLAAGGCDSRFDRVQDYELMLRLSRRTQRIRHLPKILYHWRMLAGSIARESGAKGAIDALHAAAVQIHLDALGLGLKAVTHPRLPHRVQLLARDNPTLRRVSIILNHAGSDSLPAVTHPDCEWVVDASQATGECLLFLQAGLETMTVDWVQTLQAHLELPGVGAVSPQVVGADGKLEYAGDAVLAGQDPDADGPGGQVACSREATELSSACFMIRRSLYLECRGAARNASALRAALQQRDQCCVYVANVRLRRAP